MRKVSIFGATGSIGQSTIDLIRRAEDDKYQVIALTGGRNTGLLAKSAKDVGAQIAVTAFPDCYEALKQELAGTNVSVAAGPDAIIAAAEMQADWMINGIVGFAGLAASLKILEQGATLALANKESLVSAGSCFSAS